MNTEKLRDWLYSHWNGDELVWLAGIDWKSENNSELYYPTIENGFCTLWFADDPSFLDNGNEMDMLCVEFDCRNCVPKLLPLNFKCPEFEWCSHIIPESESFMFSPARERLMNFIEEITSFLSYMLNTTATMIDSGIDWKWVLEMEDVTLWKS
jgi:hypothetical protein